MHLPVEDFEPLRVEYLESFYDSVLMLDGSPEAFRALIELLDAALIHGETVPTLDNSTTRVLRTARDSGLPPVRLFFTIERGTIKFMHVAHYVENEP
ncbi:MAG TPA: hypothetical protein VKB93_19695 [Thermoanaerobaculia bacterium]|nr:hypothetical protein [Thermoanaerobaculia bacterium]